MFPAYEIQKEILHFNEIQKNNGDKNQMTVHPERIPGGTEVLFLYPTVMQICKTRIRTAQTGGWRGRFPGCYRL